MSIFLTYLANLFSIIRQERGQKIYIYIYDDECEKDTRCVRWKIVFWGGDRCVRRHPAAIRPEVEKEEPNSNLWPDVARFFLSHSHFQTNKNFQFLLRKRNVFFFFFLSDAPKEPRHSPRSSSITPRFSPHLTASCISYYSILPFAFICLLHNTLKRYVVYRLYTGGNVGLSPIDSSFKVAFDLIWRFNQRWCKVRFSPYSSE